MSRPFLEEVISTVPSYGSALGVSYKVVNQITAGGKDYTRLLHPYPILNYDLAYNVRSQQFSMEQIVDLFHRSSGTHGGFRLLDLVDYSTNNYTGVPTETDQLCLFDTTANRWQIVRWYGTEGDLTQSRRLIRKVQSGTTLVASNGITASGWTVNHENGRIRFDDMWGDITGISLGADTVITLSSTHILTTSDTISISGITGTTELNNTSHAIKSVTSNTITLEQDSSSYTAWVSGGKVAANLTAGCYYHIPVRFAVDITGAGLNAYDTLDVSVPVVEILNP